ncbi:MAG: helix-turn-helix domain-containing protein [Synergistaceae bacterium]|jgi:predicted transcriptional regulator|nr:helix-turn-helix domain-containing protein [Synergistaceae bacterium]
MTAQEQPQKVGVRKKRWIVCFEHSILDLDLSIYEKMVYIVLCSHAKKDGPAFPSVMTIAQEASCSRTKVFEALNTLEERGIITRENRIFPKRGQTSNLYEIEDIEPRPQDGPGTENPPSPSVPRTPVSVTRTGVVRHADAHLDVLEQDLSNRVIEHPPLPPQGEDTQIPIPVTEPEEQKPEPMTQGQKPEAKEPEQMTQDPEPGAEDPAKIPQDPAPEVREPEPKPNEHESRARESDPMTQWEEEGAKQTAKQPLEPQGLIEAIIAAYNKILPELPTAGKPTSSRERAVKRRVWEDGERGELRWWERYFSKVREFPWLMGNNPSNWRACFDWLVGERGMLKVLEGGFGRSSPTNTGNELWNEAEYEVQRRFTDENGVVDVRALFNYLDGIETA